MKIIVSVCFLSILSSVLSPALPQPSGKFMGNRYLTLNTVVRVNQIEVTRDRDEGEPEAAIHTLAHAREFREAISAGWPEARIT